MVDTILGIDKVGGQNYDFIKEFSIQSHQITSAMVIRCGLTAHKKPYGITRNLFTCRTYSSNTMDRLLTLLPGSSGGNGMAVDHN